MPADARKAEIEKVFFDYMRFWFNERDLEKTLSLFRPSATGFGTGLAESAYSASDLRRLFSRDHDEAPRSIDYTILKLHVSQPKPDIGIVSCQFSIATMILKTEIRLNNLRLSMVLSSTGPDWFIEHMHLSFPSELQGESETYPLKELEDRNRVLERLVEERTASLEKALEEVRVLAITDKLTGLSNRLELDACLEREVARCVRYGARFSVILFDLDLFKSVNDRFGHLAGDRVLVGVAAILRSRARKSDIVGRWGGEEFLVLCPESDSNEARSLAESLRRDIADNRFGDVGYITASFGFTSWKEGDTPEGLVARADQALYCAKNSGRNAIVRG